MLCSVCLKPTDGAAEMTEMYSLTPVEAGSSQSRCQPGWPVPRTQEDLSRAPVLGLEAAPSRSRGVLPSVSAQTPPFLRTPATLSPARPEGLITHCVCSDALPKQGGIPGPEARTATPFTSTGRGAACGAGAGTGAHCAVILQGLCLRCRSTGVWEILRNNADSSRQAGRLSVGRARRG